LRKEIQKRMQTNNELNTFLYAVAHDLKTPVVSLQGLSSMLIGDYESSIDDNSKMYIQRIQKNSEQIGILIEDLIELSNVYRKRGKLQKVDVSDVISDAAHRLSAQMKDNGTDLTIKGNMPVLQCDREAIGKVFINLIDNANKFIGENNINRTIEVGYNSVNGYHKFYVKDNGIGIDAKYHKKIFESFQKLDSKETRGTGLGLSLTKRIIEAYDGDIWVNSESGKGTTVFFTLPKDSESR